MSDAARSIKIVDPGLLLTVQDLGRSGVGAMGVSPAGAVDRFSARAANILVGNSEEEAVLESTMTGFAFETRGPAVIALTGADARLRIDGSYWQAWRSHRVPRGARVEIDPPKRALRCYVAINGGILVSPVLGSRSTDVGAGFGGRVLAPEDGLELGPPAEEAVPPRAYPSNALPEWSDDAVLRALPAHGLSALGADALEALTEGTYSATARSTRQALHLSGASLTGAAAADPVTGGMCAGCVQLTREGQPLVLLAEHQTTGGYPVAMCVVTADLPRAAQVRPGGRVRFVRVSLAEAVGAMLDSERRLRSWCVTDSNPMAGGEARLGQGFFEGV